MDHKTITLTEARRQLKEMGYKLTTRQGTQFTSGTVKDVESGDRVSGCNCLPQDFYQKHKAFFTWKSNTTILEGYDQVTNAPWRVIL